MRRDHITNRESILLYVVHGWFWAVVFVAPDTPFAAETSAVVSKSPVPLAGSVRPFDASTWSSTTKFSSNSADKYPRLREFVCFAMQTSRTGEHRVWLNPNAMHNGAPRTTSSTTSTARRNHRVFQHSSKNMQVVWVLLASSDEVVDTPVSGCKTGCDALATSGRERTPFPSTLPDADLHTVLGFLYLFLPATWARTLQVPVSVL